MVEQVSNAFGVDKETVEKVFRDNKKIDSFLNNEPNSPPKLFFFYQKRQHSSKPELYLSPSTFLRCTVPFLYVFILPLD